MTTELSRRALLAAAIGALPASRTAAWAQPAPPRTWRGLGEDEWLARMATRPVSRMVSRHSSTAVVFRLDLGDGVEAAFKPERPGQESWWRNEIVSYRLARLLRIEHRVPPVAGRTVPATVFGRYAASDRLVTQRDGSVRGSAAVWVPDLHGEPLHTPEGRRAWSAWLTPGAEIPAASRERARQISEVLVFDYLMANYDRWNCCNIPVDARGQLVVRDNDAGWFASVMNRLNAPDHVRRLSRTLWNALHSVDASALRTEAARDPMQATVRMVGAGALAAYDRRRARLLRHVDALIAEHGESAVLAWP